jgi:hypothetical protein
MTRIIYLGAEVGSNRTLLETTTANHVGVSFYRLMRRGLPKTMTYLLSDRFSEDTHIYAHAGIPKTVNMGEAELEEFCALYEDFIANNIDRLTWFNEVAHAKLTPEFIEQQRRSCWAEVPPSKFQPIWQSQTGINGLKAMSETYLDIGLLGDDIEHETQLAAVTKGLTARGTRFHAISTAKPDNLRQVKVESASTLSWLAPMLHGETIVWDGQRLVRYNKKMKEQARTRYRHVYEKAGLDYDLIMEDDPQEVCRLAVWSYEQFEMRLNMGGSELHDNNGWSEGEESGETGIANSDNRGVGMRKLETRNPAEIVNLPVFGYQLDTVVEDDGTIKDVPLIRSHTCFIAANCPAFKPQNSCAFNLPVEIKTKDQLKSLITTVVEMQGQRVAFARFTEELNGGYPDPNVSQEIDRLFKLIKTVKELDDSTTFIKMTVEGKGASAGVLSNIFGDRAQALKELPNGGLTESETTKIITDLTEQ